MKQTLTITNFDCTYSFVLKVQHLPILLIDMLQNHTMAPSEVNVLSYVKFSGTGTLLHYETDLYCRDDLPLFPQQVLATVLSILNSNGVVIAKIKTKKVNNEA
jgi:hypothetical protein